MNFSCVSFFLFSLFHHVLSIESVIAVHGNTCPYGMTETPERITAIEIHFTDSYICSTAGSTTRGWNYKRIWASK